MGGRDPGVAPVGDGAGRRRRRLGRRVAVLVAVAAGAAVAISSWPSIVAQTRAVIVLVSVLQTPVVGALVRALTDDPRESDRLLAGVPTTVFRPAGEGSWPAVVLVNGVTRRGRQHPTIRRLAEALARAGYVVLVPDPPGLAEGELTTRTLAATVAVARSATAQPGARGGRVSFVGVSAGASLALLAAAEPTLSRRVALVAGLAPYVDLVDVVRLATTGFHRDGATLVPYAVEPFVSLVAARSLVAALPAGRDRSVLTRALRTVPEDSPAPLAFLRQRPPRLGLHGRAVIALLANRDPRRFDRLFAALPVAARRATAELSPIHSAGAVLAEVELVSAPRDKYFPPAESRAFVRAAADARLTLSSTLQHADLEPSLDGLADLTRLDGYIVRSLRAAAAA